MGTCEGYYVLLVEYVSLELVDSTEYLLELSVVTEAGTGWFLGGKILCATLEAVDRRKLGGGEVVGEVLSYGYIEGARDDHEYGSK